MSRKTSNTNSFWLKSALITSIGFIAFRLYQKCTKPEYDGLDDGLDEERSSNIRSHWGYEVLDNQKEASMTDLRVLIHSTDHFNGVRINSERLPRNKHEFTSKLQYSLQKWINEEKRGVFLKIPVCLASFFEIALSNGFSIHHARPSYIMLIKWLPQNEINMIPDYCHTYIATGCLIINKYKEAVIIKEIWNHGRSDYWKLPGGAIDRCENIFDAAIRETKEETGLHTEFKGILQFRHLHPFRFRNSGDIYFISLLKYDGIIDNGNEFDIDKNEIDEIKWMNVDHVLELKSQQPTFGSQQSKNNIKKNVDILIKNWDNNNDNIGLQTLKPINSKKGGKDREFYVYAPINNMNKQ